MFSWASDEDRRIRRRVYELNVDRQGSSRLRGCRIFGMEAQVLGKRKSHLLALQYAPEHLQAMKTVRRRLDPPGILERGMLALVWAR